jgi:peptide/nickel transport system substrate-binding protein
MYQEIQRSVLKDGPFIIMLQEIEVMALRKNVEGVVIGPSFDTNFIHQAKKN